MEKLIELFKKFPGIGQRQAKRFVYFLMHSPDSYRKELQFTLSALDTHICNCHLCNRTYIDIYKDNNNNKINNTNNDICLICQKKRNNKTLLIVAYDTDIDVFEKYINYEGAYYVLGKYIPLFTEYIEKYIHMDKLYTRIENLYKNNLEEIILATNASPDGDYTARILKEHIEKKYKDMQIKITTLARGIATGGELEYADGDTLREAIKYRR